MLKMSFGTDLVRRWTSLKMTPKLREKQVRKRKTRFNVQKNDGVGIVGFVSGGKE